MNNIKVDINIEYAHIYSNENYNREHFEAGWIANQTLLKLTESGLVVSTVILVDEYNPSEHILDINGFVGKMKDSALAPDFIAYESKLIIHSDDFLESIQNPRWKNSLKNGIRSSGRTPCSVLAAIWYLVRLGIYNSDNDIQPINGSKIDSFPANKIITILPQRYMSVEQRAMDYIKNSTYREYSDRIEHIYH